MPFEKEEVNNKDLMRYFQIEFDFYRQVNSNKNPT